MLREVNSVQRMIVIGVIVCVVLAAAVVTAGTIDSEQSEWHKKYKSQENAPDPEQMLLNRDSEPKLSDGFKPLFNGKDLTGWTPKGGTCTFEAKDGCIVGKSVDGSASTYLCTEAG